MQVIEVPHAELTKWTSKEKLTGRELHERAANLAATGEAEVIETVMVIARSGERALVESIGEVIYPTEWEPPTLPGTIGSAPEKDFELPNYTAAHRALFSFETRDAGATLEIEPMAGKDGQWVDLRYAFHMVDRVALETWMEFRDQWGDASMRVPIFGARRITSAVTLHPGTFELCNVFTPNPPPVPAVAMRQLVFVRCDVLPLPK